MPKTLPRPAAAEPGWTITPAGVGALAAVREAQAMADQAIGVRAGRPFIADPDAVRRLGERAATRKEIAR